MKPRVKICCIMSQDEARLAIAAGASALGLVASMPSGPGVIADANIRDIARTVPPGIATFLLTSRRAASDVVAHVRAVGTSTVQLVDTLTHGSYAQLRDELPNVKIVQVVHVSGPAAVDGALAVAEEVDALLLDSGNPHLRVKQLGGTGRRHDWTLSRQIRDAASVPVYLAGGLRDDNVADAIASVDPFGVDVCTGVRSDGRLDAQKLNHFMSAVEKA